jgi:hypothetical protein
MHLDDEMDLRPTSARTARFAPALYPAAVFLSALLLFAIEPMFTKMVLPRIGVAGRHQEHGTLRRKFLTCLVMIDYDNVAKYAQDANVTFTDFGSLCRTRQVQDLIWSEIDKVNKVFARVESIKKFRLIEHQLSAEDDELTPTMKLKRKFVNEKYKELIESMYTETA